jgi:predicted transcriptional regulator
MSVTANKKAKFAMRLTEGGYDDFLILDKEEAEDILTSKRQELLELIDDEEPESITELAHLAERDVSIVHRDLDLLFKYSLVEYDKEDGKKRPKLKHSHVFVEPIF